MTRDIGTGIPAANNIHEVAQSVASSCRVVYVDYDPGRLSAGVPLGGRIGAVYARGQVSRALVGMRPVWPGRTYPRWLVT